MTKDQEGKNVVPMSIVTALSTSTTWISNDVDATRETTNRERKFTYYVRLRKSWISISHTSHLFNEQTRETFVSKWTKTNGQRF